MSRKKSKSKKDKPLYDEDGKWVEQDNAVLGGIRRAYRRSPQMQEVLKSARVELPPLNLKNGKPGKRVRVRYRCAICDELFSQKNVQVDHCVPVVKLWTTLRKMSWNDVVKGIFCSVKNLQVLCSTPMIRNGGLPSCHAKKSREENWIRKKITTNDLTQKEGEALVEKLSIDFQQYLIEQKEKQLAKEERKRVREEKRAVKLSKDGK